MRLSSVTFRIIVVIFFVISLSLYINGCSEGKIKASTDSAQPSGDAISYSKDIQSTFTSNCALSGCHGSNPPSGLKLTSYNDFTKGGVSGKPYIAGDSTNSLIIKRLEGKIGPRMPMGGGPLKADQIQKIKSWIDAGGKDN